MFLFNPLHPAGALEWLLIAILLGLLLLAGFLLYLLLDGRGWLPRPRKLVIPALLLAGLPLAWLALAPALPSLTAWFYHALPADGPAATGAEAAAGQQAAGFVPFVLVGSKLLAATVAYLLMSWLPFRVQGLTHPGPTDWAKKDYTTEFEGLAVGSKFEVYTRLQQGQAIRAAAALLFGCLVV